MRNPPAIPLILSTAIFIAIPGSHNVTALACRTIYNMCTQKPPNDYSEQLYNRYRDSFSLYTTEKVAHPLWQSLAPMALLYVCIF